LTHLTYQMKDLFSHCGSSKTPCITTSRRYGVKVRIQE